MRKILIAVTLVLLLPFSVMGKPTDRRTHKVETTLGNGIKVTVDERFELISTSFRLAGAKEYVSDYCLSYMHELDEFFSPSKAHPLIGYIQELRKSYNFAYSIAAKAAMMVEIKNGHVLISPDWDLLHAFEAEEICWNEQIFRKFVSLLDSFYRQSKFHSFFISHLPYYGKTVEACKEIPSQVHIQWFQDFFGMDPVGVDLIIGLCIGPSNYSIPDVCQKKDWDGRLAICIGASEDASGIPFLDSRHLPTIIHEIGHYYSNPLVDLHYEGMKEAMDSVYSKVSDRMTEIGYGNACSVTGEWINDLFVNCYLKHDPSGGYKVAEDVDRGYIWMERAVLFMDHFFSDRETYPTIREFMPQLVSFVNTLPGYWPDIEMEFENRNPYVVEVYPAGVITSRTKEIRITFSAPMNTGIYGIFPLQGYESLSLNVTDCRWEGDRTFVLDLNGITINPGTTYGIRLPSYTFISARSFRMKEHQDLILEAVEWK